MWSREGGILSCAFKARKVENAKKLSWSFTSITWSRKFYTKLELVSLVYLNKVVITILGKNHVLQKKSNHK